MSDGARYARVLLRQAAAGFSVAPEERVRAVLPVLDAFLAQPGPLTFLAASRVLVVLKRDAREAQLKDRVAGRVFDRARLAVSMVDGVDKELMQALGALEVDAQAGARLHALAHMLTAYQELAGRSEAATAALRRQFNAVKSNLKKPAGPGSRRHAPG